jgi:hypothetical protein
VSEKNIPRIWTASDGAQSRKIDDVGKTPPRPKECLDRAGNRLPQIRRGAPGQMMRTAAQCLSKAAEMDQRALCCPNAAAAADYKKMALTWRALAQQAAWQDGFPHLSGPRLVR